MININYYTLIISLSNLVIPNVMGICFYSPPLDEMGNTVRGVQFCETFVKLYNFQKVKLLLFLIEFTCVFQKYFVKNCHFSKVTGELLCGSNTQTDPTRNKYECASQLIIHLLMAASAGDETALKW